MLVKHNNNKKIFRSESYVTCPAIEQAKFWIVSNAGKTVYKLVLSVFSRKYTPIGIKFIYGNEDQYRMRVSGIKVCLWNIIEKKLFRN